MRITTRTLAGLAGFAIFVALIVAAVRYMHRVTAAIQAGPAAGQTVTLQFVKNPASVPALTLHDLDGHTISSSDWRGKVVLVNFWATWCPPCRAEIPDLIALQKKYRDQLLIIGVSIDDGPPEPVKRFATEEAMNYPVVMETPELHKAFSGVFAVPTTFVVDRQGRIVQKHVGLASPATYELETRALAGLPVNAKIETVEDTGTVSLANAAEATDIPGTDLAKLPAAQKTEALKRLNAEHCTCGCDLTVAQCRINDPSCGVSLPIAQKIVDEIAKGGAHAPSTPATPPSQ